MGSLEVVEKAYIEAINLWKTQMPAETFFAPLEIVSGTQRGVDSFGEMIALGLRIPLKRFPPEEYGAWPACGPLRNQAMVDYVAPDGGLIAIPHWDYPSPGTRDCIRRARKALQWVFVLDE